MADQGPERTAFLQRWSERKHEARQGHAPTEPQPDSPIPEDQPAADKEIHARETPKSELTDADMPAVESLTEASDYSGFLSEGVSESLRQKALSRLFHSPSFNLVDGLDDYAEDFAAFVPLGDLVTSDMRHRLEQQAERLLGEDESKTQHDLAGGEQPGQADQTSDTQDEDTPSSTGEDSV